MFAIFNLVLFALLPSVKVEDGTVLVHRTKASSISAVMTTRAQELMHPPPTIGLPGALLALATHPPPVLRASQISLQPPPSPPPPTAPPTAPPPISLLFSPPPQPSPPSPKPSLLPPSLLPLSPAVSLPPPPPPPPTSILATSTSWEWDVRMSKNCWWDGHGAEEIDLPRGSPVAGVNGLDACKAACLEVPNMACDGILWKVESPNRN